MASGMPLVDSAAAIRDVGHGTLYVDPRWVLSSEGRLISMPQELAKKVMKLSEEKKDADCRMGFRSVSYDLKQSNQLLSARVDAACAGLFSFPWRFLPGWRLLVNGKPENFVRVNDLTLGVVLDPGVSRLEARFSPPGFGKSILITFGILLCLFLVCLRFETAWGASITYVPS
jgi:hypothetical protein